MNANIFVLRTRLKVSAEIRKTLMVFWEATLDIGRTIWNNFSEEIPPVSRLISCLWVNW